jgi:23S rRNA (uracil1939-C5)-methyltransferase
LSKKNRKPLPQEPVEVQIESINDDGLGLAHIDGKAVFLQGALPGERVRFRYTKIQRRHDEGVATSVLDPSPLRAVPRCPHFGVCGGCSLQHLEPAAQIGMKEQILAEALHRIGKVAPAKWLPALADGHWGYRRKARLGVRYVQKKGRALVGFRERGSSFIADLGRCDILHPEVGGRLQELGTLVSELSIRDRIPQIEVAMGDGPCVLVFRVLDPPSPMDVERLIRFGDRSGLHVYCQQGGAETVEPLAAQGVDLHYRLPGFGVELHFEPSDFTQVNHAVNRLMVDQSVGLLEPQPGEKVLDLFCGLGNFSLPLARRASRVVGVEGDEGLVARARANARRNGIHNVDFHAADLYGELGQTTWEHEQFDKALLDPPRSGALAVIDRLPAMGVRRIVYVSCYPSTLARDADRLVNALGYRLLAAGVMDMFPHTAHTESVALFGMA